MHNAVVFNIYAFLTGGQSKYLGSSELRKVRNELVIMWKTLFCVLH